MEENDGVDPHSMLKKRYGNPKSKQFRQELKERIQNECHPIIIDCSFSHQHSDKDEKSLIKQLTQILGANRKFDNPFKILLTGVSNSFQKMLDNNNADRWLLGGVYKESYLDMEINGLKGEELKKKLVYLTGDAEESMEGFEDG